MLQSRFTIEDSTSSKLNVIMSKSHVNFYMVTVHTISDSVAHATHFNELNKHLDRKIVTLTCSLPPPVNGGCGLLHTFRTFQLKILLAAVC